MSKLAIAIVASTVLGIGAAKAAIIEDVVLEYSTLEYSYTAYPGEVFYVNVSGDGDTDLDLHIRNPRDNVVCIADGATDDETCRVYSPNGGVYRIMVENLGGVWNRFLMLLR